MTPEGEGAAADLAAIAQTLRASTVRVHDAGGRGYGSGIVWDERGTILTNAHVVRGGYADIERQDGSKIRAQLVRRDPERDLAALRVAPAGFLPARIRSSASVLPGELAVAVGNPHGLRGVVTAGLVQRSGARWVVADVRLAPGNSGGPLADAWGRVIGINAMVAYGEALAIPSDVATAFARGATDRRLGVQLAQAVAKIDGNATPALVVAAVEAGSVAERAGLALGDAILASDTLQLATSASLEIVRAGRRLTIALPWPAEGSRAA